MSTACRYQLLRVRTVSGKILGRIYDLRCARSATSATVTHLVVGRRGLLERLGFRGERFDALPWSSVREIRDDHIVVADAE